MNLPTKRSFRFPVPSWARWAILSIVTASAGAAACYLVMKESGGGAAPRPVGSESARPTGKAESEIVRVSTEKWAAAGIRVEPAAYSAFVERVWRSGHLTLNDTRIAHISPMVEGVVREVKARLGQDVRAGDVLVVLDCREVGQAKLDLVKARLAAEYAKTQHAWTLTTTRTANELVEAVAGGAPMPEVEKRFKDRPIGDLRQQLMTAYSRRLQTKAHYEAINLPDVQGAVSQANVIRLRADFEAAEAAFRALCEEVKFQTGQQTRASEQKLREAQTAESLSKATLMMLGYSQGEVAKMDPIAEGPGVSLYPIRAPFSGTVIEQHAVLAERVGPQIQMFQIADLSTLWLRVDVPQKDVPLVRTLAGGKVKFRLSGEDATAHEAEVFYTGDVVDRNTRAVALSAVVPNPDRALKPGTFVEVELARPAAEAVQVPAGAVQHDGAQPFVFVHVGSDEFHRVDVKLGRTSGEVVEVVQGLKPGQPVAAAGGFVLKSELFKDRIAGE